MEGVKFSLSFSKVIEKKILKPSALKSFPEKQTNTQQEIIESIEENIIKSNAPQEKELVIPVLPRDQDFRFLPKSRLKESEKQEQDHRLHIPSDRSSYESPQRELTLEEQAEQALLAEASDPSYRIQQNSPDVTVVTTAETISTATGSLPTLDDFEEVGVENFGSALLRGMGWKKGEGVGPARNREVVPIIEATSKTFHSTASSRMKAALKQQQEDQEGDLTLKKGAHALISSGRHKGSYGIVESVEDNCVLVRKAVGGEVVLEVEGNITLVTKQHYTDSSRVINKEMFDKFKEAELNKKNKKTGSTREKKEDSDLSNDSNDDKISKQQDREEWNKSRHRSSSSNRPEHKRGNSHGSSVEKLRNAISAKRNISDDKNLIGGAEKEEKTEARSIRREIDQVAGVESLDSKSDTKNISEVGQHERCQNSVESREAERDLDDNCSNLERSRNSRKGEDFQGSEYIPKRVYTSKRHSDRSKSPGDDRQSSHKKFREAEKSNRSKSDHHSRKRDEDKSSRMEAQSKEEYLLSKYGDASVKEDRNEWSQAKACSRRSAPWVREGLTVRITSEKFKGGKYFKEKVVVVNVVTAVQCECRTSEGKLLLNVPPDMLETVIPKLHPRTVMIVKGRHVGMIGRVLEQHKNTQEASVQLLEDRSEILRLQYEQICQYNP